MRIGIDVDDTLTNSYDLIVDLVSKIYDVDGNYLKSVGATYDDFINDNNKFPEYEKKVSVNFPNLLSEVPLKENASSIINKLHNDGHEIFFITARNRNEYGDPYLFTCNYLKKNDVFFDEVLVEAFDKGQICLDKQIDLFIDDSIRNCTSTSSIGIDTYLFDTTYNRKNNTIKRVSSWQEVYDLISNNKN